MRARHLEAAGANGNENGQARQHWAKYAALSQRTKVKNFILKKPITAIRTCNHNDLKFVRLSDVSSNAFLCVFRLFLSLRQTAT